MQKGETTGTKSSDEQGRLHGGTGTGWQQMGKQKQKKLKRSRRKDDYDEMLDRGAPAFDEILELVSRFCETYLNEEYRELCEDLTRAVYAEDLPIYSGKPAGWASGIVHVIGWVNFLCDRSFEPYMSTAELAAGFGVSVGTMMTKSKMIRDRLQIITLDPDWSTEYILKDNPLVWTLDVNGIPMDIRWAPREVQELAFEQGLIPYIPADNEESDAQPDAGPKVIKFPSGQGECSESGSAQRPKDNEPGLFDGLKQ